MSFLLRVSQNRGRNIKGHIEAIEYLYACCPNEQIGVAKYVKHIITEDPEWCIIITVHSLKNVQ